MMAILREKDPNVPVAVISKWSSLVSLHKTLFLESLLLNNATIFHRTSFLNLSVSVSDEVWSGAKEPQAGRAPQQERGTTSRPCKQETWKRHDQCTEYNIGSKKKRLGRVRSESPQG